MRNISNFLKESGSLYPEDELVLSFKKAGINSILSIIINGIFVLFISFLFISICLSGENKEIHLILILLVIYFLSVLAYYLIGIFYNSAVVIINKNGIRVLHKKLIFDTGMRNIDIQNVIRVYVAKRWNAYANFSMYCVDCVTADNAKHQLYYFREKERAIKLADIIRNFYHFDN